MKKQSVFMIIILVVAVMVGWDFQNSAMAAEQPAMTETVQPEPDNDSIYSMDDEAVSDLSGDEEVVSDGDSEEGEPISPDGEVEGSKDE